MVGSTNSANLFGYLISLTKEQQFNSITVINSFFLKIIRFLDDVNNDVTFFLWINDDCFGSYLINGI